MEKLLLNVEMKKHWTAKEPLSHPTKPPPPPSSHLILITLSISLLFFLQFIAPFLSPYRHTTLLTTRALLLPATIIKLGGLFGGLGVSATEAGSAGENSRYSPHSSSPSPHPHHRYGNEGRISWTSRRVGSGGRIGGRTSTLLISPVPWWTREGRDLKPHGLPQPPPLPGLYTPAQGPGTDIEDISLAVPRNDKHGDWAGINNQRTIERRKTKESVSKGIGMMDMDQIMNDMGAWNNPHHHLLHHNNNNNNYTSTTNNYPGSIVKAKSSGGADPTLFSLKIIPDQHHVSTYLTKGILKRFLFLNDKFGNPLSITITPCTSILLWNVKFWPVSENGTEAPQDLKTYRTQRIVTFTERKARRGIYSIDIRPLHWDSYVHLYGTSFHPDPVRNYYPDETSDLNKSPRKGSTFSDNLDKFYQHNFSQADNEESPILTPRTETLKNGGSDGENPLNRPYSPQGLQMNANANAGGETIKTSSAGNKPRIWVRRLRGNRLQVKWDTSPINPHLMNYCIVVNTRRDYTTLCSASGERFGVLPPDLMHVTYYGSPDEHTNLMVDNNSHYHGQGFNNQQQHHFGSQPFSPQSPNYTNPKSHRHRHGGHGGRDASYGNPPSTHQDILLGCINKKTHYILNNLQQGRLYYFNVFIRDLSTNVSYPYVRTTLNYQPPKNVANGVRDAKPMKVTLSNGNARKVTILKFNLNKPCNELTMYVMPCGGGSIRYEALHGNRSVYQSSEVDSLDIIKIPLPQRGKYFIKISQASEDAVGHHQARMAEVYVGKKNKRFPLPKLPPITKLSEDESQRRCDAVSIQWWPSPDPRDNEYCIFLKEESRKRIFQFKKPNQCDVERSLKSDPYVTHSLCLQRTLTPQMMLLSQKIVGLQPGKTYVIQLILRRHSGKSLSYDLTHVKTDELCAETYKK